MRDSLRFEICTALAAQGYVYFPAVSTQLDAVTLVAWAKALGPLHVSGGDLAPRCLETRPSAEAAYDEPFDGPEGLGWHNDFASQPQRPVVSLAYLARADPQGPTAGAWRVASCDGVLDYLQSTPEGSDIVRFLRRTHLPFSFSGTGEPTFLRVVEPRGPAPGRLGLRFYGRAMRDGARLAYGQVPEELSQVISAVEAAADAVGQILAAAEGALLVTDNWHALHDRLPQTVVSDRPLRRSLLCFVDNLRG